MTIEDLSARVEHLERANRRLRALGALALVLAAAGIALGQAAPVPKLIQAERFEVLDAEGTVRAALGEFPAGSTGLKLYGEQGRTRVAVLTGKGPPMLAFHDAQGQVREILGLTSDGDAMLTLTDGEQRDRARLSVGADGTSSLMFNGPEGKDRVALTAYAEGQSGLILRDRERHARATVAVGKDGTPLVTVCDSRERLRGMLGIGPSGGPVMAILGEDGKPVWREPK